MSVDPGIKVVLDAIVTSGAKPLDEMPVDQSRAMLKGLAAIDGPVEDVAYVTNRSIPGPAGDIPVRVYTPAAGVAPRPVLVWLHGGGWVLGDLDTADPTARKLANRAKAIVVSVDYRLAPEHPFPAAADDCFAALRWVAAHAGEFGGDATRVAVGGDSAGGNLAAVVSLLARDAGAPALSHQLLVYPVIDATLTHPSITSNGENYFLTQRDMEWFVEQYAGTDGDLKDAKLSPLYADSLRGVPSATVITAEYDPLRDEGEAYAARLREEGVAVEVRRYDGMIHGFFAMATVTPVASEAVDFAGAALYASFTR